MGGKASNKKYNIKGKVNPIVFKYLKVITSINMCNMETTAKTFSAIQLRKKIVHEGGRGALNLIEEFKTDPLPQPPFISPSWQK